MLFVYTRANRNQTRFKIQEVTSSMTRSFISPGCSDPS